MNNIKNQKMSVKCLQMMKILKDILIWKDIHFYAPKVQLDSLNYFRVCETLFWADITIIIPDKEFTMHWFSPTLDFQDTFISAYFGELLKVLCVQVSRDSRFICSFHFIKHVPLDIFEPWMSLKKKWCIWWLVVMRNIGQP